MGCVCVCVCFTSQPSPQLSSSRLRLVRLLLLSLRPIARPGPRASAAPSRPGRQDGGATPADEELGRPSLVDCAWSVCGKNARSGHSSQERRLCACSAVSVMCTQYTQYRHSGCIVVSSTSSREPRLGLRQGHGLARTVIPSSKVRSSSECLHCSTSNRKYQQRASTAGS